MNRDAEPGETLGENSGINKTSEADLEKACESIRSECVFPVGTEKNNPWKRGITGFKESFLLICTLITSVVAVGGLVFTIFQFNKTMETQRHSTVEAAVGQFVVQVMELSAQANLARANDSSGKTDSGQGGYLKWIQPNQF